MGFAKLKKQAHSLFDQVGFLCRIENTVDYENALALMDDLIEDYDYNRALIDILWNSIEAWEEKAPELKLFNKRIKMSDPGIAVLKTLMDQYSLGVADFPEIGSKYLVSKILNRKRRLTFDHIQALSKRFRLNPLLFFDLTKEAQRQSLRASRNKKSKEDADFWEEQTDTTGWK